MDTFGHYDTHLGPIYSWMVGDFDAALGHSTMELSALGLPHAAQSDVPRTHPLTAIDLGAGIGLHALPLARMGYAVTAIDSCAGLLAELQQRAGALQITTISANLLAFKGATSRPPDVILCMGDTLTHLPDEASVASLMAQAAGALAPGGIFAATFRDYVTAPLQGTRRFIPVRSDANRILTCFLEYQEDTVLVHDLLHEASDGGWSLRVSCYSKLRLDPAWVAGELQRHGLEVRIGPGPAGMTTVRAVRARR